MYILYCVLAVLFLRFMNYKINILRTHAQNIFYTNFGENLCLLLGAIDFIWDSIILRSMFLKKTKWCFDICAVFLHPREANTQEIYKSMVCSEVNSQPDSTVGPLSFLFMLKSLKFPRRTLLFIVSVPWFMILFLSGMHLYVLVSSISLSI